MHYGNDYKHIPLTSVASGTGLEALPDLFQYTVQIVNIQFVGRPGDGDFVLIDAGMPHSADKIISITEERFGVNSRPKAIILTHGHFDHVGAVLELVNHWNIPVYAHVLELPYLTGKKSYPKIDPNAHEGLVAKMAPMFPKDPIDLTGHIESLAADGSVPFLPEFKWIHTPGHTPGHISLFREKDKTLIAGDAFITVRQESLYQVLTQKQEVNGPPEYFTSNFDAANSSIKKLQALYPEIAVTGHGAPISGKALEQGLAKLT